MQNMSLPTGPERLNLIEYKLKSSTCASKLMIDMFDDYFVLCNSQLQFRFIYFVFSWVCTPPWDHSFACE